MTDRPIPFSAPMILALLDGRKTQTRRVLTPQPEIAFSSIFCDHGKWWTGDSLTAEKIENLRVNYTVGDRLWVREAWKTDRYYDDLAPSGMGGEEPLIYVADSAVERWGWKPDALSRWGRFRQGRFMPRWASRLTLTVTDVRVQRVQEISETDSIAEGCRPFFDHENPEITYGPNGTEHRMAPLRGPVDDFRQIWENLNAKRGFGWDANPWVAAYTFDVHRCNIDQMDN
ncbi:hypothetical protein [Roseovarius indicus]|uniref:hypothetical protein n=1 Tax=Roseovarius indicus TaxID=540747 RepID=UPI0007DA109F|nr:hypothetical protein [Roseovarius indicus]OAO02680.1 hypothetical protein A8B76_04890 [Roseovarius indicus]